MGGGLGEAMLLGFGQGGVGVGIEGAGVFQLRAEARLEELGRHLVVLGVGRIRVLGDGAGRHLAGELRVGVRARFGELAAGVGDQELDGGLAHDVGERRAFEGVDGGGDETHDPEAGPLGGSGKKALTRAW